MTQYQKAVLVMDYLQSLGVRMIVVGRAVCDKNLEASYKLIQENPKISKTEFLQRMQITEE